MSFSGCKLKYAFNEKNVNPQMGQDQHIPQQDINQLWKEKMAKQSLFLPKKYEGHFGRHNRLTRKEYSNLVNMNKMKQTDEIWKKFCGNENGNCVLFNP